MPVLRYTAFGTVIAAVMITDYEKYSCLGSLRPRCSPRGGGGGTLTYKPELLPILFLRVPYHD